jgi:Integrase core domain/Chromo (CHRromatin Organisation MOdifier) domain
MLKNAWINKNKKYAFSGISKIYEHYKGAFPIKKIQDQLSEIQTYTRHKEGKKISKFNPFFVHKTDEMWQLDIMYLPNYKKESKGYKYLLCVLDVFSRKMFIRKLRKKDTSTIVRKFDDILLEVDRIPEKIVVDKGSEFKSQLFKQFCEGMGINLIFTYNETKAAHVERAQRSFQNILYRILEEHQTRDFLRYLNDTLEIYNNRVNRTIGYSPNFAYIPENHEKISINLEKHYNTANKKTIKPRFKKGDCVRIREVKHAFSRGYHPNFTEEIFKVKKVLINLPIPRYIISNYTGEEVIKGSFYGNELTLVNLDTFKVEKVLKTKKVKGKRFLYVKWLGYPISENSWVESSWLKKIK